MTSTTPEEEANRDRVLPTEFYYRDTTTVARELLGRLLQVRDGTLWRAGVIVEDEAYLRDDPANHAYRGPTARNRSMFRGPGTAYVYKIHGVHCMNVVTREGEAVLVRAVEPLENVEGRTDGPGRVCQALGITRERHDGMVVTGSDIQIVDREAPPFRVGVSRRVGVTRGRKLPLRFYVEGNAHLSQ